MKNFLSTIDLTLWLILIVSKLILCLCIFKKHFAKRLLYFSLFIFVSSAKSLLLVAIASWASYNAYYDTFYFGGYLESALGFLTLIECGRQVLPGLDLPKKEKAFAWLGAALAAVFILAIAWPLPSISPERNIEIVGYLSIAVVFLFIAVYSRYLGLHGSRLLAGITATLGLLYLVEGVIRVMVGHYPAALVVQVRQLSQIANVLAVIAWIVVVLSPWGEQKMTETDLQKIELAFTKAEAGLDAEAERVKIA
ncbi:MAG TPA: hypothetical protein VFP71_12335 [Candidatus Angelobacter sp.]|nr:hypothetical protein [Candidatus Angelobacter sp.]